MTEFMELVKEMRNAQKEYFKLRKAGASHAAMDALQRSKALESRVDEEIRKEEAAANVQADGTIIMADGRKLVQGNLFEDMQ